MVNRFNINFINIGDEEAYFSPDNYFALGKKFDCQVITISEAYTRFDICFYSATGYAWELANNARILEASAELWIILSQSGNASDVVIISRLCAIKNSGWAFGSNRGQPIYLGATDGQLTVTLPATPNYVRIVGWIDSTGTLVRFNPTGRCFQGV